MVTIRYSNIKWDIDDEDLEDPDFTPPATEMDIATDPSVLDDENVEEIVSDMLTESTGWCHKGFDYTIVP